MCAQQIGIAAPHRRRARDEREEGVYFSPFYARFACKLRFDRRRVSAALPFGVSVWLLLSVERDEGMARSSGV